MSTGRFGFAFSANGRHSTCVRASDAETALESWALGSVQPQGQAIPDLVVDAGTRALPLDDGRIVLFQTGRPNARHRYRLVLVHPGGGPLGVQMLGAIPAPSGGYLLPSPSPGQIGFAVALDSGQSRIWRLSASPSCVEPVVQVPGMLDGGVWLDSNAQVLAINHTCGGDGSHGIAIDLARRSWKVIWSRSVTSADRILLGSLRSKILTLSTTVSGEQRLGWARLGDPTVHFPDILYRSGYERRALTLDDHGERLLVHEVTGALSRLFVFTFAEDRLEPLAAPQGKMSAPACWAGNLIRCGFSAPTQPPTLATIELTAPPRWSVLGDQDITGRIVAPQAELIELAGPAGGIEAIVYGGSDWRICDHLVIALHGGPLSSWRFGFEPLFHCLATHGVAVLAPNYRGSTGYGAEHLRAVLGNWAGPDLDDVLELGRSIEQVRASRQLSRPVVLGVSYGAFLALLAACRAPRLWSACVALAPFLSGPRFHGSATAEVRRRIARLGGLHQGADESRDVLRACVTLSAPLLLMHGAEDETIPATQSRMLRRRLIEIGRIEGVDFEYIELDCDHGSLIQHNALNQRVARFCLARSDRDPVSRSNRASSHNIGKRNRRFTHNSKEMQSWTALTW